IAAWFDFEAHRMPELQSEPIAGIVPKLKVGPNVNRLIFIAIRGGESPASADGGDARADSERNFFHGVADFAQVSQIGSRADVHMQVPACHAIPCTPLDALFVICMPDAMLRLLLFGISLLAMAMAKPWIDAE